MHALLLLSAAFCAQHDAIGISPNGDVYHVDSAAGTAALVGSSGYTVHSLARSPEQRYFTLAEANGGAARLVEIDPTTGGGNPLAQFAVGGSVRAAAFDLDGTLIVIVRASSGSDALMRIDLGSLTFASIGDTGSTSIEGLCVSPEGRILAWETGPGGANGAGLIELSRSNGALSDIGPIMGSSDILALAVDERGELRGSNFKLYDVSRLDGQEVPNSPNLNVSLEGLEFIDGMTPLDGALAMQTDGAMFRLNTRTGVSGPNFGALSGTFVATAFRELTGDVVAARDLGTTTEFISIDPFNGAASSLGVFPFADICSMWTNSFYPELVYAIENGSAGQPDRSYLIHFANGTHSPLPPFVGVSEVEGSSSDYSTRLICWDRIAGLHAFSFDGTVEDIVAGPTNLAGISSIRHDPFGRLFGAQNRLFELHVMSETEQHVGASAFPELAGFEFMIPPRIPRPTTYCTAQSTATCLSTLTTFGPMHPSASEGSGFEVLGLNVAAQKQGLFFYGLNGPAAVPLASGAFMCVKSPVRRTPVQSSGGVSGCSGVFRFALNQWVASGADPALVAGVKLNGQFWYRDPGSPSTSSLTQAVEFILAP